MAKRGPYRKRPLADRLAERTEISPSGCWLWTGALNPKGYGTIGGAIGTRMVHRVAYEVHVGPIPDGFHLDHTCHTGDLACLGGPGCIHRRCINPAHLEAVSVVENVRRSVRNMGRGIRPGQSRKTHCVRGHEFTEANTYRPPGKSRRVCRQCVRDAQARLRARRATSASSR